MAATGHASPEDGDDNRLYMEAAAGFDVPVSMGFDNGGVKSQLGEEEDERERRRRGRKKTVGRGEQRA